VVVVGKGVFAERETFELGRSEECGGFAMAPSVLFSDSCWHFEDGISTQSRTCSGVFEEIRMVTGR
jgi:hypothetical protein